MIRVGPPRLLAIVVLPILAFPGAVAQGASDPPSADVFAVRTRPPGPGLSARPPSEALAGVDVGESFCNPHRCIVVTKGSSQLGRLRALETEKQVFLEPLPDAHSLFFRYATWDAKASKFDRDFPGMAEVGFPTAMGQYVAVLKSYLEEGWIDDLAKADVTVLAPFPSMGAYVYGPKDALDKLPSRFGTFVDSVLDVPAGLKRTNVDFLLPKDDGGPASTTVSVVAKGRDAILGTLKAVSGEEPRLIFSTGSIETYGTTLSQEDALTISLFPEVIDVARNTIPGGPSDERSNRIIAGAWQQPGTSWAPTLPANSVDPATGNGYWDSYQCQLSSLGLDLSHQVIGFLDTGVDSGLMRNGTAYCPPHLRPPGYPVFDPSCRLVFTTDVSRRNDASENRANDPFYHGTFTTAITAGMGSPASAGRDSGEFAFTEGVASGAKVAVSQIFAYCGTTYRSEGNSSFDDSDLLRRLSFSLVELGSTGVLPSGQQGPGAVVFNHSWNYPTNEYETTAQLIDRATRSLSAATFTYGTGTNLTTLSGPNSTPSLHVISAGNHTPDDGSPAPNPVMVTAPATAKNAIVAGATETISATYPAQRTCSPIPCSCPQNDVPQVVDSNFLRVAGFSRIGYPNSRLKPDLVAPGRRAYGRVSSEWVSSCLGTSCNMDLLGGGSPYGWSWGTSFAAPVVSGAVAVTREWLATLGRPSPSPALIKAILIATARNLMPCNGPACPGGIGYGLPIEGTNGEWDWVRPAPDRFQGWGGVSLDHLFRPTSNYFFLDQEVVFTPGSSSYPVTLQVVDTQKDVNIALVWTDRASDLPLVDPSNNLVNDLDLEVESGSGGAALKWFGNSYYLDRDDPGRDGYSLAWTAGTMPSWRDQKNNVERITIRAGTLPSSTITVHVVPGTALIKQDALEPSGNGPARQDFALVVENAHQ